MSPSDRRFALGVSAAVIAATLVPYLYGWIVSPPGSSYVWGVGYLPDTIGNLVFTRQGRDGRLLFANPYTGEAHPPRFFHPLFLLVGWGQRLTGWPPGLVFQLVRLAAAAALLRAAWTLAGRLLPDPPARRTGFLLAALSGGLGWLGPWAPFFWRAADVRGAEVTTFFSLYQQPHFSLTIACLAWMAMRLDDSLVAARDGRRAEARRAGAGAGILHLVADAIHPYDAPIPIAVAVLLAALRAGGRGSFPAMAVPLALFAAPAAPLLLYNLMLTRTVPVYRDYAAEGLVAVPWPVVDYALGYAPLLPLVAVGLARAARDRDPRWRLPIAWLVAVPALLLLPIPARRKLLEGYHLFLAPLAALGWSAVAPRLGAARRAVGAAGLTAASLSSLFVMARDIYAIRLSLDPARPEVHVAEGVLAVPFDGPWHRRLLPDPWTGGILQRNVDRYHLPPDLLAVLRQGGARLPRDTVVLAAFETGLVVPMFSPLRVVAGHVFGTLRLREKLAAVSACMDRALSDEGRRRLLGRLGAGAILWDGRLERLGEWRPGRRSWLRPVAASGDTVLYALPPPPVLPPWREATADEEAAGLVSLHLGRLLLDEGHPGAAREPLLRAAALRPADPRPAAWLTAAERGTPAPPPPP